MLRLGDLLIWMRRIGHCRGFGVQSPTDYRFVRYVVNEHYPYYAYEELERALPDIDRRRRKLCRLYFRIANYLQPKTVVDYQPTDTAYSTYINAGCRKAEISTNLDDADKISLLRMDVDAGKTIDGAIGKMSERSVLLLEGIHRNREARNQWKRLKSDERVGVTFDLYYVGIAFLDRKRYKQNYIVNF